MAQYKNKMARYVFNKETIAGLGVMQIVTSEDEWVAEAYMETNYSKLTEEKFIQTVKDYVAFNVKYDEIS